MSDKTFSLKKLKIIKVFFYRKFPRIDVTSPSNRSMDICDRLPSRGGHAVKRSEGNINLHRRRF